MTRSALALALAAALASAGHAQDVTPELPRDLPADVVAAVEEAQKQCGGKLTTAKDFITRRDINADKVPDVIVSYEHARCEEMASVFCGTGGCVVQVFASTGENKFALVMDRPAYRVKFERRRGLPAMIQHLHGGECGRSGGDGPCESVTYWNGGDFTPAYPLR